MVVVEAQLLIENLPVVGGNDNQGVVLYRLQSRKEPSELPVHVGRLSIVERVDIAAIGDSWHPVVEVPLEHLIVPCLVHGVIVFIVRILALRIEHRTEVGGGKVGGVRVPVVQEQEEGLALIGLEGLQHGQRRIRDMLRAPQGKRVRAIPLGRDVGIKAPVEVPPHRVDSGGVPAVLFQDLGQKPHARLNRDTPADIDDIVGDRLLAREHGGKRRVGRDIGRVAALKDHPLGREGIDNG